MESESVWVSGDPAGSWSVHDHAYGYRNPDGLIIDYDPQFMLYAVVSYRNVYWNDGYYYRRHGHYWERSRHHHGPWAAYRLEPPRVIDRLERPIRRPTLLHTDASKRRPFQPPVFHAPRKEPIGRRTAENGRHPFVHRPHEETRYGKPRRDPRQQRIQWDRRPEGMPAARDRDRGGERLRVGSDVQTWSRPGRGGASPQSAPRNRSQPRVVDRIPDRPRPLVPHRPHEHVGQARNQPGARGGSVQRPKPSAGDGKGPIRHKTRPPGENADKHQQVATGTGEARGAGGSGRHSPGRQGEPRSDDLHRQSRDGSSDYRGPRKSGRPPPVGVSERGGVANGRGSR